MDHNIAPTIPCRFNTLHQIVNFFVPRQPHHGFQSTVTCHVALSPYKWINGGQSYSSCTCIHSTSSLHACIQVLPGSSFSCPTIIFTWYFHRSYDLNYIIDLIMSFAWMKPRYKEEGIVGYKDQNILFILIEIICYTLISKFKVGNFCWQQAKDFTKNTSIAKTQQSKVVSSSHCERWLAYERHCCLCTSK